MPSKARKRFDDIDAELLDQIDQGVDKYIRLCVTPSVKRLAQQLAKDGKEGEDGFDRVIDRRLQALRKKGLIRFSKGRWASMAPNVAN